MKILHIIYTNGIAGAEKHLFDLLPGLKEEGIESEFIAIGPKNYSLPMQNYADQMAALDVKTTLLLSGNYFDLFSIAKKINRYIIKNKINAIHSHLFTADLIAVLIKTFYNKSLKILSTKHGYHEDYLIRYGKGNKKIPADPYYFISRFVNKRIDESIASSQFIADLYGTLKLGKKMKFIHHGINMNYSKDQNEPSENAPKILIVGRLVKVKGHKFLIDAMPAILNKFPELQLLILGEGALKNELELYAKNLGVSNHLKFLGFQKPEDYASQCRVMIIPSLFEAFGLVFIEAFALKIPVIAFDVGAGNEIISDKETGLLVPPFKSDILAEKIIYLLENPAERSRLAENAYQTYLQNFTTQKMVSKTAEWYRSVI